jgi:hypothetical protein
MTRRRRETSGMRHGVGTFVFMLARPLLVGTAAATLLAACTADAGDEDAVTTTSRTVAGDVAASELVTGDCVSGLVIGAAERALVTSVSVVDCGAPHEVEVFAGFELSPSDFEDVAPGEYPGEEGVVAEADRRCARELERLGAEDDFGLISIWPTATSWAAGDRGVECAVFGLHGEPLHDRGLLAQGRP